MRSTSRASLPQCHPDMEDSRGGVAEKALEAGGCGGGGGGRASPDLVRPPCPASPAGVWPQGVGPPGHCVTAGKPPGCTPGSASAFPAALKAERPLATVGEPHSEGIRPFVPTGPTVWSCDTHDPPGSPVPRDSERPNAASMPCSRPQGAQGELPAHARPPGAPLWAASCVPTLTLTLTLTLTQTLNPDPKT